MGGVTRGQEDNVEGGVDFRSDEDLCRAPADGGVADIAVYRTCKHCVQFV